VDFSSPIFFVVFFAVNFDGDIPWIVFSQIYFKILYDLRVSSTFLWTFFFNVVFCVCSLLIFFLSTRCQYYMNPVMCNLFPKRGNDIFEIE
jgi:hypothetical protein